MKKQRVVLKNAVIVLLAVMLLQTISAFEFDNVKSYDPNTRTIIVTNIFGFGSQIGEAKLLTPLNVQVPPGYQKVAEFEIKSYDDYSNALSNIVFYNKREDSKEINREYDFKYKTIQVVKVPDYETTCKDIWNEKNKSLDQECTTKEIGSHEEKQEVWVDMT